jgi:hypothetical protein
MVLKRKVTRILAAAVIAIITGGLKVAAAESGSDIAATLTGKQAKRLESTASTTEDHLRLAAYYRALALKLEGRVRYYEDMAEWYRERPLPFDGKLPVSTQKQAEQWASYFRERADRAVLLTRLHEAKAHGSTFVEDGLSPVPYGRGFDSANDATTAIYASPEQTSRFHESMIASHRLIDRAKIVTYLVSATGQPPISASELQKSVELWVAEQEQFLQTLTESQKAAVRPCLRQMEELQPAIERGVSQLSAASPESTSYVKAARNIRKQVEEWHIQESKIGNQLRIPN